MTKQRASATAGAPTSAEDFSKNKKRAKIAATSSKVQWWDRHEFFMDSSSLLMIQAMPGEKVEATKRGHGTRILLLQDKIGRSEARLGNEHLRKKKKMQKPGLIKKQECLKSHLSQEQKILQNGG